MHQQMLQKPVLHLCMCQGAYYFGGVPRQAKNYLSYGNRGNAYYHSTPESKALHLIKSIFDR